MDPFPIEQHASFTPPPPPSTCHSQHVICKKKTQVSCSVGFFAATEGEWHMTDGITMDAIFGHAHCVMCVHLVCTDDLQSEE